MKQKIIIVSIIFCSFFAWIIGALWVHVFTSISLQEKDWGWSVEIQEAPSEKTIWNTEITKTLSLKNIESEITSTIEKVSPSIVSIIINKDLVVYRSDPWWFFQTPQWVISRQVWGGSWFFIKSDGTILTNKHVVEDMNAEYTVILSDGTEYPARVLALDPVNDLAVIKIDSSEVSFAPLEILPAGSEPKIWEFTIAVWNALAEFQNSVSLWIVSGKNRTIEAGGDKLSWLIQTDAAINPGNSGWPLMNLDGYVIGINTAIASNSSGIWFSFALTKERIDYILESIVQSGEIKRPFIGINYIPNSPGVAEQLGLIEDYGIYIINDPLSVVEWSNAQKAWLKPWDLILSVNGEKLTGQKLTEIIQNSLPWELLNLEVLRWEEKMEIILELWSN